MCRNNKENLKARCVMMKMKVLQVNKLYYPAIGGIERTVQLIAEGLREQVDMSVLVCQSKGKGCVNIINGIAVRRSSSLGVLFSLPISFHFLFDLRKMSKDKDILQLHAPFPLGDLACLLSGYKGKVVLYWHSDVVKQKKLMIFYRPIMELFLKRVDVIIVAAKGIVAGSSYLVPYKEKCVILPFAVNPDIEQRGRTYLEHAVPTPKIKIKFLFVGRLVYYKGVDILLDAFKHLDNAELDIVGTGDLEDELKSYTNEYGLFENVHFLGKVEEERLYQAFEECDVFVLPSVARSEAFGLVQLEAMAYGKPVINTNLSSGVPEVSVDGITGLTVEPGNSEALREAMQWMIMHPEARIRFGKAARKRIEEFHTQEKFLKELYQIYKRLAAEGAT